MTRADPDKRPKWLSCKNALIPDMLAIDPTTMPVFEITGAEFSKSEAHTADGISIRFPRITKQRNDKSPKEATSLTELKHLFEASKDGHNLQLLTDGLDDDDIDIKTTLQGVSGTLSPRKRKQEYVDTDKGKKLKMSHGDAINKTSGDNVTDKGSDKDTDIFKDILLYVSDGVHDFCKEELRYFKKLWGEETRNAKKCTHVLHKSNSTMETLESARYDIQTKFSEFGFQFFLLLFTRKIFNPRCRHVDYHWLIDSIQERKLMDVMMYPVTI